MKWSLISILALCVIIISCQDEITNKAVFATHEVTRTTEGASFQATIAILDGGRYNDYGFAWSKNHNPTITDSVYFFGSSPIEGNFTIDVNNDLVTGSIYYVRAFLMEKSNIIYSNQVAFESLGSATPVISSFTPGHGNSLDTIAISGSNFSGVRYNNRVKIGSAECEVLTFSRELLKVRLPASYVAGSFPIEVNVSGKAAQSKEAFVLDGPSIQSLSPASGPAGTIVTLTGSNFSTEATANHVVVGAYRAEVLTASTTTLVIRMPEDAVAEVKDISIEINEATMTLSKAFTLTGPTVTSVFPTSGIQGSIVTVEGTGFSEKLEENRVSLGWNGYAEIISATTEKLVVKVPWTSTGGKLPFMVSVRSTMTTAKEEFTILLPEVTGVEPGAQYGGRTIKLTGKNLKAEPHVTSAYFEGTGLVAPIESVTDTEMVISIPYALNRDVPIVVQVGGLLCKTSFDFDVLSPWVSQPDFPGEGRYGAIGFSIGQYGYVGMGITTHGDSRDMWRFDSNNGTWKRMADFPGSSRAFAISFVIGGKAYVGLGGHYGISHYDLIENFTDLWEYDPAGDSWTEKSRIPDYILVPSGMKAQAAVAGNSGYFYAENGLYRYNADSDVWSRTYAAVSSLYIALAASGKLYFGGYNAYLYEYDPNTTTWQYIESGSANGVSVAFAMNNKLYLCGYDRFKEYDPAKDEWRSLPSLSTMPSYTATFTIGNTAYLVTGADGQGTKSVVTFNPNY